MTTSIRCYNYGSVYGGGKEFQLEQVRASLAQYRNDSGKPTQDVVCYQKDKVYSPIGGELQLEQVRAMLPQYQPVCEMEMTQIATTVNALNSIGIPMQSCAQSVDDQLELLCAGKLNVASCALPPANSTTMEKQPEPSLIQDKENIYQGEEWYTLSPEDMESAVDYPGSLVGGDGINTKLNFTDTESFVSVHSVSAVHGEYAGGKRSSQGTSRFNVISELELKAKLLQTQQDLDKEFAMTEVLQSRGYEASTSSRAISTSQPADQIPIRRPLQPLTGQNSSLCDYSAFSDVQDESSFIPYHDSMQENTSSYARKPLQSLTFPKSSHHDCSANPSQASFSVYENTCDQSSFSVFHDSMQTSSSFRASSVHHHEVAPPVASAPLRVPLSHHDHSISDQTFTQMDIAHPRDFEPVSTPKHKCMPSELIMDLSAIPSNDHYKGTAPLVRPSQLTPIKEEPSGSSKFSSSSSRFTASSSSSSSSNSCHSVSGSSSDHHNPFLPDMVNRMLNSLGGVPPEAVQVVPFPLPPVTPGQCLSYGHHTLHVMQCLHQGKFSTLYLVRNGESKQVLRVYSNTPLEWEVTILSHLQSRLEKKNLQKMSDSFLKCDQVYLFESAFVTVSRYHSLGSMQSVMERYSLIKKMRVPESLVNYFAVEMFSVVGHLHRCGIIHAALKPAHFLIRDIRGLADPRGMGLCLTDLRHAIDTCHFAEEQLFVGVPPLTTSILMEGQPWKWQLDYNGLAMCLLPLIGGASNVVRKCPQTGLFSMSAKPYKAYNTEAWHGVMDKLLNADSLLLEELGEPFYSSSSIKEIIRLLHSS